jgi:hypothetical protein
MACNCGFKAVKRCRRYQHLVECHGYSPVEEMEMNSWTEMLVFFDTIQVRETVYYMLCSPPLVEVPLI